MVDLQAQPHVSIASRWYPRWQNASGTAHDMRHPVGRGYGLRRRDIDDDIGLEMTVMGASSIEVGENR
jgi:hypothetical protein